MENAAAEEIIEEGIDLEEIAKKYEERGFFRRLGDMFKGLGQPHDTRAGQEATVKTTWNNGLDPNKERGMSMLYIVTLLI